VAGGDASIWQPIFATNRQHVLDALDLLSQTLAHLRESLEQGDYESLTSILQAAAKKKRDRDALGD
jgi:prephenate dehydrogenase